MTSAASRFYTFRNDRMVVDVSVATAGADAASLAAIEAMMLDAHKAFWGRRYREAITGYQNAAARVYALLDPGFDPWRDHAVASRNPALFQSLVAVSAEYLNILPVTQPAAGPVPRVAVDPALLADKGQAAALGLRSMQVDSREAATALASVRLAQNLASVNMPSTAGRFTEVANSADPALVKVLQDNQDRGQDVPAQRQDGLQPVGQPPLEALGQLLDATIVTRRPVAATGAAADAHAMLSAAASQAFVAALQKPAAGVVLPPAVQEGRTYTTSAGDSLARMSWQAGSVLASTELIANVYESRVHLSVLPDVLLSPMTASDYAVALAHFYYYTIPLALAECYHALGDYAQAETEYLDAAGYQYINLAIESPYVWTRLATLYLDWGNSLYESDDPVSALPVYSKVLTPDWQVPADSLYTVPGLKTGADVARQVIAALPAVSGLGLDTGITAVVLDVRQQLLKIAGGLDYWGVWQPCVPIWTFDYLQQVAANFTQLAVSAERDVISFWNNADQATLTRRQLSDAVDQAAAEVKAQNMALAAANAEVTAYQDAQSTAEKRRDDAKQQAIDYGNLSGQWIMHQALSAQMAGGDNGDSDDLTSYADQMMSGSYSLTGSLHTMSAAEQLTASRLNQEYELGTLNDTGAELDLAATQAGAETAAAQARAAAAQAGADAAQVRADGAAGELAVFNEDTFTPDAWTQLGNTMFGIYHRYYTMALRAARLMQKAYNFETDQALALIKNSYTADEVNGLLGADLLMADIQSFTYDLITGTTTKPQPVKQTISLAGRFGYLFETQFRKTGTIDFTTLLDDFEGAYPGSYAARVQTVEVAVEGIVPPTGISGLLTNSGVSVYRLPSAAVTDPGGGPGRKFRVQPEESLILSDYSPRTDALTSPADDRMNRVFQGAGPASTWHLELPPAVNDLDYGAVTDVKLTFSYQARFDPDLRDRVLAAIAGRPGFRARQRAIPLRWVYPDAFFAFQRTGTLSFQLRQRDFPLEERSPVLTSVGVVATTTDGLSPANLTVSLTTPAHTTAVAATTDAAGSIESSVAGSLWAPLADGTAVGGYTLAVTAAANPQLVTDGKPDLSRIANLGFVLGYTFTGR